MPGSPCRVEGKYQIHADFLIFGFELAVHSIGRYDDRTLNQVKVTRSSRIVAKSRTVFVMVMVDPPRSARHQRVEEIRPQRNVWKHHRAILNKSSFIRAS